MRSGVMASGPMFDVTPADEPKFWYLVVGGALIGLLMFWLILPIFFAAWAIWKGLFWKLRPALHLSPSSFRVSPTRIEAGGRTFPADDIHELTIRNALVPEWLPTSNVVIEVPPEDSHRRRAPACAVAGRLFSGRRHRREGLQPGRRHGSDHRQRAAPRRLEGARVRNCFTQQSEVGHENHVVRSRVVRRGLAGGCVDDSKWVDFPMATCEYIPQFDSSENFQFAARATCSQAGAAFSGEARCVKDAVQIQCK